MTVYTKEDYSNAYSELVIILNYIPKYSLRKIPIDEVEFYINNRNKDYKFVYDENNILENQNIMKLTKILLANLYINYLAEDCKELQEQEKKELLRQEEEKKEKYSTDNIFKNYNSSQNEFENIKTTNKIMIVEEKNIFQKILLKIKSIFWKK